MLCRGHGIELIAIKVIVPGRGPDRYRCGSNASGGQPEWRLCCSVGGRSGRTLCVACNEDLLVQLMVGSRHTFTIRPTSFGATPGAGAERRAARDNMMLATIRLSSTEERKGLIDELVSGSSSAHTRVVVVLPGISEAAKTFRAESSRYM